MRKLGAIQHTIANLPRWSYS